MHKRWKQYKKMDRKKKVFKMLTIVYFVYNLINVYTVKQLFNLFTWSSNYMILLCDRLLWSLDHVRGALYNFSELKCAGDWGM